MYHVYLLKSRKDNHFYVGYTNNIERRLKEHNTCLIGYTKKYKPWKLIYYESFISLEDTNVREKRLKYFGRAFIMLKKRLRNSLNKLKGAG